MIAFDGLRLRLNFLVGNDSNIIFALSHFMETFLYSSEGHSPDDAVNNVQVSSCNPCTQIENSITDCQFKLSFG